MAAFAPKARSEEDREFALQHRRRATSDPPRPSFDGNDDGLRHSVPDTTNDGIVAVSSAAESGQPPGAPPQPSLSRLLLGTEPLCVSG